MQIKQLTLFEEYADMTPPTKRVKEFRSTQPQLGVPYQGSKRRIATKIVDLLPAAETFVDLFAGGCAVTHAALLSGKYKRIITNDISNTPQLFIDAVNGKYRDERRWVSREDFFRLKDTDPYIANVWSFGNNRRCYLYSREFEPYKRALHELFFAESVEDRRRLYRTVVRRLNEYLTATGKTLPTKQSLQRLKSLQSLQCLQSLEGLQSLQRLQSLEGLERLQSLQSDYRNVELPKDCVVYCDPPYKGTNGYGVEFDYEQFLVWLRQLDRPVFISEYEMPPDFIEVANFKRTSGCYTRHTGKEEKLFTIKKS